jgi:hypothetical protein
VRYSDTGRVMSVVGGAANGDEAAAMQRPILRQGCVRCGAGVGWLGPFLPMGVWPDPEYRTQKIWDKFSVHFVLKTRGNCPPDICACSTSVHFVYYYFKPV